MCELKEYVRNCVVSWKNLHSWQKFNATAGRDKFQSSGCRSQEDHEKASEKKGGVEKEEEKKQEYEERGDRGETLENIKKEYNKEEKEVKEEEEEKEQEEKEK